MKKNYEERLLQYFEENNIRDKKLQEAIKTRLGYPTGKLDKILNDIDENTQVYIYDVNFESILDLYSNLYCMEKALEMFNGICGYFGTDTLFVTEDLEGILVTTY